MAVVGNGCSWKWPKLKMAVSRNERPFQATVGGGGGGKLECLGGGPPPVPPIDETLTLVPWLLHVDQSNCSIGGR